MKIFEYLEYLTNKERQNAAKYGQSNLVNIKYNKKQELSDLDRKFLNIKNKRYNTLMKGGIKKNSIIKKDEYRLVMCHNGNYYCGDINYSVHDYLIECAFYDDNFPRDEKLFKDYYNERYFDVRWNRTADYFKYFICLHYLFRHPDKIFLSESYLLSTVDSFKSSKYFDFYTDLVINKLDLEIIPENVSEYY